MSHFLEHIRPSVIERVKQMPRYAPVYREPSSLCEIFTLHQPALFAEIKFAQPNKGRIYQGPLNACDIAGSYLKHGAAALSILTEPFYFDGNIAFIREVRAAYPQARILQKDFILDEQQIAQAAAYGADAILLIAAFLEPSQFKDLYTTAMEQGLAPLIEIHSLSELEAVMDLSPQLLGINNRNLHTLEIDLRTSLELLPYIPLDVYVISESGIQTAADMQQLSKAGADGFLIGSSLMQEDDPGMALKKLLKGMTHAYSH